MDKNIEAINIDPMGEPYILTAGYRERTGQSFLKFDPAVQKEVGWLATFLDAIRMTPAEVVIVGQARSGKTVLAQLLKSSGVKEAVTEHRLASEASFTQAVHLIVLRQNDVSGAHQLSEMLGKRATMNELLALPRGQALIRVAGKSNVALVDIARPDAGPLFSA